MAVHHRRRTILRLCSSRLVFLSRFPRDSIVAFSSRSRAGHRSHQRLVFTRTCQNYLGRGQGDPARLAALPPLSRLHLDIRTLLKHLALLPYYRFWLGIRGTPSAVVHRATVRHRICCHCPRVVAIRRARYEVVGGVLLSRDRWH